MNLLHPHSFRGRVSLWIGSGTILLTGLLLTIYSLIMCSNLVRYERTHMRRYASTVIAKMEAFPRSLAIVNIHDGYDYADPRHTLCCSIYIEGEVAPLLTLRSEVPIDLPPPDPGDRYRFTWDLSGYENFMFRLRMDGGPYTVMLLKPFHTEALERIVLPGVACMLLGLGLALWLSAWVSRKVVSPVRLIAATAREIRQGHLHARIPDSGHHDEIQDLIDTLNSAFCELEQTIHQIGQFSANSAHELRTPLTAIRGHLDVCLRRTRSPEEYQETIRTCVEQIDQLQDIVNSLLLLARPGRDRWQADFERINLTELAQAVVRELTPVAQKRGVTLRLEGDGAAPVSGVETFLHQMVYNLVHNAIKFSPGDGTVVIAVRADPDRVRLAVRDHGPGVAPALHERIFELFFQDDNSRGQGVGLGLALVKWIVDMHAGTVDVRSPGEGAVFEVTLARHRL